jgi:outer membrane protein assembly factor BamA
MNRGSFFGQQIVMAFCLISLISPLALLPPSCWAQATQAAPQSGAARLASVEITGSSRFRPEQILAATSLRVGADITRDDMQKAADFLARLGPFATVRYRYSSSDAGVRAEYQVTDAPAVLVAFDNFPWFTDDEITAALKSSVPLFDGAAPTNGTILDAMADALETLLIKRGTPIRVSHELTTAPLSNEQVQVFRADNSPVRIAGVDFTDPLAHSDRAIQQRLPDLVGKPYSRTAVELFEFEQVRPVYLERAFLHVRFGLSTARFVSGAGESRVTVVAPIEPGPAFVWNGVAWSGNAAIASSELDGLIGLRPGDLANGMKIEASWQAVSDAYTRRGYLDVKLSAAPKFDDTAKRVTYAVAITEGPQYRMGKLVLSGLSIEGERRIRAAWKIAPGAIFDQSAYQEFLDRGIQEAFAGLPFHYEKIGRFLQRDPKTATVEVLLDFQ